MDLKIVFVDKRAKVNSRGEDKSQVSWEAATSLLVTWPAEERQGGAC